MNVLLVILISVQLYDMVVLVKEVKDMDKRNRRTALCRFAEGILWAILGSFMVVSNNPFAFVAFIMVFLCLISAVVKSNK